MSQTETGKAVAAEERTEETRSFVRRVRTATRRKYTPEEKTRIVLEGFRREVTVSDLCRREGIKPHSYYSWTKEFMEAGKERLTRDTLRDAAQQEVHQLKRERRRAEAVGGGVVPGGASSEKNSHPDASRRHRYQRMSAVEKAKVLARVASSSLPKREVLSELGVPRSTYYRWLRRKEQQGLEDDAGGGKPPWNRLASWEVDNVLSAAREMPELSCRQLATWITDNQGFSVSESTVYRVLRREGLVKRAEMQLAAGKEYHRKTTGPHQMWATDASYFRVVGWGYYYMVTVMDDYSRFILAHRLKRDMTSDSFIEVVQKAVDRTGMDQVPITDRTRLLSDNGPGYVSRAFRDYLGMVGIRHILAAPFHPQTNGKLERYHQTLKRDVNQLPYEMPSDLEAAIVALVSYYNYRRYHKALGNVTPSDVLRGRREDILRRRREVKAQTIERRRRHNRALRELATPPSNP